MDNRLSTGSELVVVFLHRFIRGHSLHETGLQRQIGVGTLFSIEERSALAVPLINRGSTAHCVPQMVYMGFRLFVLLGRRSGHFFFNALEGARDGCFLGEPFRRRPILPSPAPPPRRAPPRPDPPVVCSLFGFDKCVGLRFFVFLERRSGHLSSMIWGVRGTVVSWANRNVSQNDP